MEVRLDLPGDQRQAIGAFLQKFPGFKDQAALDTKLDEVLDDLVREATDNQQTYTGDIKPWFDGELAYSMGPLPPAAALKDPAKSIGDFRVLALVSIKDQAGAQAWLDAQLTKARRDLDHGGLPGRHDPPVPGVPGPPAGLRDRRRQGHRDRRRVLGQGRDRYQRFRRLRRRARAEGRARFGQRRSRRLRVHGAPPAAGLERAAQRVDGRRSRRLRSAGGHRGHAQGDP